MSLREEIIAEMHRREIYSKKKFSIIADGRNLGWYCTWWFRHAIKQEPSVCRRELNRMEKEGIVTADRSQKNNTKWLLKEAPPEPNQEPTP